MEFSKSSCWWTQGKSNSYGNKSKGNNWYVSNAWRDAELYSRSTGWTSWGNGYSRLRRSWDTWPPASENALLSWTQCQTDWRADEAATVRRIPAEVFKEASKLRNEMSDEGILRFDMDQPVIFMWGSGDRSDVGKVIGITDVTYTTDCICENYIVNKTHPAILLMIAGRFVLHWRAPRNISKGFSASEDRQLQVGVEVKQITIVPLACLKGKKGWRRGIEGGGRGERGRALWNFEFFRK